MIRQIAIAFGILALAIGGTAEVNAQGTVQKGVRVGYGFATLGGSDVSGASFQGGVSGSVFARIDFNQTFGMQGELGVSLKGASGNFAISHNEYESIEITYLEAPLLLVASTNLTESVETSLFVGPTIGVSVGDTWADQPEAVNNLFREEVNQIKADATAGLALQVQRIVLDVRYDYGLTKTFVFSDAKNQAVSFSVGYLF
jgi:hypothetical protein